MSKEIMSGTQQLCTFYLGDLFLGIDVRKVQEVIRFQEITPFPLAPRVVRGLINLRGQILVAVDLRARLKLSDSSKNKSPLNVIVRSNNDVVSFLVDGIGDVLEIENDLVEKPLSTLNEVTVELIEGVVKLKERLLLVLDTEKTLNIS